MILVAKEDVLNGLKRFKRLAKQDFLASALTSNPAFWITQAEWRRKTYDKLSELVKEKGLEDAYQQALEEYQSLPDLSPTEASPEIRGRKQALEMFFTLLGVADPQRPEKMTPTLEMPSSENLERM